MKSFVDRKSKSQLSRDQAVAQFGIWEGDLVLDVGCGGDQNFITHFLRANVLVDPDPKVRELYVGSGVNFVAARAEALPFRDKTFQFCYCCHAIEHVNDPQTACEEMSRVSERGFILCPTKLAEILRPFDYHKWMVSLFNEKLMFEKKPHFLFPAEQWQKRLVPAIQRELMKEIEQKVPGSVFNVTYPWFDRIDYEIARD